ncbi:uncharacterized protein EURHEDRAFT_466856 [Aspergillus ruber CBS 135680]|uniref:non-specific serine/threonine protein kinase n=1 Tax=Aspergillus ruber (strain CBS 135680) TaxID=1388766 RepID=A0A017S1V7_ASPRC|nr:uncharacterized protein EURHEDRAFT_466856 [Aspergillus ruber CBS 135680]EYE90594.1 hypothetical protein EURHEDRAFT_466856 [Aspergillus ruber CBS 135680]
MTSPLRWTRNIFREPPLASLRSPTTGWKTVPASLFLDEEHISEFQKGQYYPVNIGDISHSRYRVIGKLGFGRTSTVWLARDMEGHAYVTLKVYTRDEHNIDGFQTHKYIITRKKL